MNYKYENSGYANLNKKALVHSQSYE